jgi:Asp-tRNA(Asn)/Glu-tRNA(Gln) amidotransferase A subunit family amidase
LKYRVSAEVTWRNYASFARSIRSKRGLFNSLLVYASVDHHPEIIPEDVLTMQRRLSALGPNRALAAFIAFPAIVVPGGFADGLPVGIEVLGRAYSEGDLLKIAYSYEQATLHRRPPWTAPPLPGEP